MGMGGEVEKDLINAGLFDSLEMLGKMLLDDSHNPPGFQTVRI